jgi:hypothetical protein
LDVKHESPVAGAEAAEQANLDRWLQGSRNERHWAYNRAFCRVKDAAMRLLGVSQTTLEELYIGIADLYSQGRLSETEFRSFDGFWSAWREFASLWDEPRFEMSPSDLASFLKLARIVESDLKAAKRRPAEELLKEPCPPSAS